MNKLIVAVTGMVMLFSSVAMASAHHKNKTCLLYTSDAADE